ncbi:YeiH family protein [Bacillus thermotolerans]|uniref:Membrane protein YeiH n=1 Tax=Bacillus thermotolerans TaxID=1221996 RepID=A0A0F5HS72_BACTR|nr:YeiH family protein [Bacillus thermotolerans]KKB35574.1 putative membrane protein YeiH [Bacillus thermotolerans]KKB36098.1 putative membrane protein YeiH [Bacillus thermotolerans]
MGNLSSIEKKAKPETVQVISSKNLDTPKEQKRGFIRGILLTMTLALVAGVVAQLPFFSVMGVMIISIILGMLWKSVMSLPSDSAPGITFSSKTLLRAGIILMGLRLNFEQIISAGFSIILIDVIVILFTLTLMIYMGRVLSIDKHLSALIAVGTAICGAAAIVAVAPLIGAKKELTAISVAFIAIMGTVVTIAYTFLYPVLGLTPHEYGLLTGATLHELAHVIAAAAPGGIESGDTALLVKLGRVALLIPVAVILGVLYKPSSHQKNFNNKNFKKRLSELPVPWFIFGFLAMCLINTIGFLPNMITQMFIALSVFLLSMAMAGLGLSVNFSDFKKLSNRVILTGVTGALALVFLGWLITQF